MSVKHLKNAHIKCIFQIALKRYSYLYYYSFFTAHCSEMNKMSVLVRVYINSVHHVLIKQKQLKKKARIAILDDSSLLHDTFGPSRLIYFHIKLNQS